MSKIACQICGAETHAIAAHLKKEHPEITLAAYEADFPGAPLLSAAAIDAIAKREAEKQPAVVEDMKDKTVVISDRSHQPLDKLFNFPESDKTAFNKLGKSVPVSVLNRDANADMIPDVNGNYAFDGEILRNALMAFEMDDINLYVWGHTGVGKTELLEQIAARTNRPMIRVQHTINTEESHIVGQWTARGGETIFELGPLAVAMKNGWVYLADEYDFGLPSVLAVYQPVLEGKSLVIKEADAANRIIKPHPNFRFVATGNTNGSGDETGLYQGTNIQNAANYDRFNMVLEVKYMAPEKEVQIIMKQSGIAKGDAEKMVDFASRIREQYNSAKLSAPISPRTLIAASKIGLMKGSYRAGVALCFSNKLSRVDAEITQGVAQRVFGS